MTITSNIKSKGFRVEGGTTLISLPTVMNKPGKQEKVEVEMYKHMAIKTSFAHHKALKMQALEKDITLAELLLEFIENALQRKGGEY